MNERAAVPYGKSIFYQSRGRTPVDTPEPKDSNQEGMGIARGSGLGLDVGSQELALYDKLSDGIQKALDGAVHLLSLANQTRVAAREVADAILAETRIEQRRLLQENEMLVQEREELRRTVAEAREQVNREEALLKDLITKRDALRAELDELERRRHQVVEAVRSQVAAINRLQESLRDTTPRQDG